ncbi:zinc finger, CCHC-type containing protein [Tanacetum coccineum]
MGGKNPIHTLGDYSKPSHEGYKNTIELPKGTNVSEDPNQHLKDFLKLVDSLELDVANRERTRLCLFQFSLRDQASNWLERLPAGSISTWEDLTTYFLAQFFPPRRTTKLCNDILIVLEEQNRNPSSSKRVHFINSIVILSKGDKVREEENVKTNATEYNDHEMTVKVEEKVEEESEDKFEEEIEEEEEEEEDVEYFDTFPSLDELRYHEWLLKNPRPL